MGIGWPGAGQDGAVRVAGEAERSRGGGSDGWTPPGEGGALGGLATSG
jgi:hypothetical protein